VQFAGEVKNFDVAKYLTPKEARRMDTFIQYGLAAAMQAVQDSGLTDSETPSVSGST
jgi:3-oxoacyl-[acyl-carrier-protein] synthase II